MKKFYIALIIIIVILALALVACGTDSQPTATENKTEIINVYQTFYSEKAEKAEEADPLVNSFIAACRKAQQDKMKDNDNYTGFKAVDDYLVIEGFSTRYEVLLQNEKTGEYWLNCWYTGDTLTPAIVAAARSNENIETNAIVKDHGRYVYDYSLTQDFEDWMLSDETPWCDFEITNEGWYHNTISHRFFEDDSTIFRTKPVAGFKFDPKFKCIVFTGELFFGEMCIGLK